LDLGHIVWTWTGGAVQSNKGRTGTQLDAFDADTSKVCQYACTSSSACVAYNHAALSKDCTLVSSVSGFVTFGSFSFRTMADK
jgi:hypothetical protein